MSTNPVSGKPESEAERLKHQHTPILSVDDDEVECELIEDLLRFSGYPVTACTDSLKVMEVLQQKDYACVLLDLHLQGMDGTDLLPIIKHKFPNLPVIIVSGYIDASREQYYHSLGAYECIEKPFSNDKLLDAISRAVGVTETIPLMIDSLSLADARDQVYRKLIVTALRRSNWNQVKAAKLLGISRYSLIRWIRKLKIAY